MVLEVAPRGLSSPALGELGRLSSPSRSASPLARRPPTAARPQRASLETGTSNLQRTSLGTTPHHVRRHTVATSAFAADVAFLQADYAFQAGAEVTLQSSLHHTKGTARQLFASETAPPVELSTVYSGITWDAPRPLSHPVHITPTVLSTEFSLGGDGTRELEAVAVTAFTMQQEAAQQEALQPSITVVQEQVSSGAKMAAATRSVHMVRGTSDLLNAVDRYAEWARRARRKNRTEAIQGVLNALGSKPALVGSSRANTLRVPHTLQSLDSLAQPSILNDAGTPAPPALSVGTA